MSGQIHPAASRGFTAGVEAYERSRPTYPPAAVDTIVQVLGLRPGRTVLDLGGVTDVVTKIHTRSKNKLTIARATVAALKKLRAA